MKTFFICVLVAVLFFMFGAEYIMKIYETKFLEPQKIILSNKEEVNLVLCYNKDGSGPVVNCQATIKCFTEKESNNEAYEIPCPSGNWSWKDKTYIDLLSN